MDAVTIFETGMVILGLIGVVDYIQCKRRGWGKNPPKFFKWGKR